MAKNKNTKKDKTPDRRHAPATKADIANPRSAATQHDPATEERKTREATNARNAPRGTSEKPKTSGPITTSGAERDAIRRASEGLRALADALESGDRDAIAKAYPNIQRLPQEAARIVYVARRSMMRPPRPANDEEGPEPVELQPDPSADPGADNRATVATRTEDADSDATPDEGDDSEE